MINTNYEQLYIGGNKSGSAVIRLNSPTPISVSVKEHTTDLNGTVSVVINNNNTTDVFINVSYSELYVHGETYSATLTAVANGDELSIPIVVNCSDTLIYLDINKDNGMDVTFTSLPEVNSLKLIKIDNSITNISSKINGTGDKVRNATLNESELEDVRYVIAANGLSQISIEHEIVKEEPEEPDTPSTGEFIYHCIGGEQASFFSDGKPRAMYVNGKYYGNPGADRAHYTPSETGNVEVVFVTSEEDRYNLRFYNSLKYSSRLVSTGEVKCTISGELNHMFGGQDELIDISSVSDWTVKQVYQIDWAFLGCKSLVDATPIGKWNISGTYTTANMFNGCSSLKTVPRLLIPNVTDASLMFKNCTALEDLGGFRNLKVSLDLSDSHLLTHTSLMNVINNLATVTSPQYLTLHSTSLSKLSDDDILIATNKGWVIQTPYEEAGYAKLYFNVTQTIFNQEVNSDGEMFVNVCNMSAIDNVRNIKYPAGTRWGSEEYVYGFYIEEPGSYFVEFEYDLLRTRAFMNSEVSAIHSLDGKIMDSLVGMFYDCNRLIDISPLRKWDTSNVKDMRQMFDYCTSLTDISPLANWDISNVMDMDYMFSSCDSLADVSPLANWNVSNAADISGMFYFCSRLIDISSIRNWDVSNVADMSGMFENCWSLADFSPLANWDTSNVTSMSSMFKKCYALKSVPLLNTSNVTNMAYMFEDCYALKSVPLLNTSNVTNMYCMFMECTSLETLGGFSEMKASLVLDDSPLLTHESLMYVINRLATVYETKALILHDDSIAKLSDAEIAIATNKGWIIN